MTSIFTARKPSSAARAICRPISSIIWPIERPLTPPGQIVAYGEIAPRRAPPSSW